MKKKRPKILPFFTKTNYLPNVVLDLDDFAQEPKNNCLNFLMDLKVKYPKFKVTLFAIPHFQGKSNAKFFHMVKKAFGDWIELAVHGWHHETSTECKEWTYQQAYGFLSKASAMNCFVKGFKAPGWQISRQTYKAARDLNFWVADHTESAYTEPGIPNSKRRPADLKVYSVEHDWIVHGHTWNINSPDPRYMNGIEQIVKHGVPWDKDSNFYFISEVI